ncbi:AVN_collapsed_G0055470.mRNA.1.CDS.1 [Saccharomyces cerevisiae]|nr:ANM_HP_G0099120.mRNA.1.CDS.1 [Saccharomyces cerevisiae]CAI5191556.1 ANM_HP_G0245800.mRNA.1.CDS.1 [Saccharomyces cerevisiae]CAI6399149.1 ANM_HP_G0099120.mRNA.1.CDS.1 [Saccharomyces cerevisiae]CAI6918159.1 ANM_collapsed_G0057320.mRNA.1.CDS.1 [Saccharomyces cerevisiae]CAI7004275.1 ANM_HP_G0245800.mRNA.1.CDS.1 [Saccharomyces cerevisiae]
MRPAQLLLNTAKKTSGGYKIPVELTPLFLAVGVALCSGTYFTYKKLRTDETLRLRGNPELSSLDEVLAKDKD